MANSTTVGAAATCATLVALRPLAATCYALVLSMERLKIHGTRLLIPPAKVLTNTPAPNSKIFFFDSFYLSVQFFFVSPRRAKNYILGKLKGNKKEVLHDNQS